MKYLKSFFDDEIKNLEEANSLKIGGNMLISKQKTSVYFIKYIEKLYKIDSYDYFIIISNIKKLRYNT